MMKSSANRRRGKQEIIDAKLAEQQRLRDIEVKMLEHSHMQKQLAEAEEELVAGGSVAFLSDYMGQVVLPYLIRIIPFLQIENKSDSQIAQYLTKSDGRIGYDSNAGKECFTFQFQLPLQSRET